MYISREELLFVLRALAKCTSLVHRIFLHPLYIGTTERIKRQIIITNQLCKVYLKCT